MKSLTVCLFALILTAGAAQAGSFTVLLDNDSYFNAVDRHYTNGLYLSHTSDPSAANPFADAVLLLPARGSATYRSGWFAGHAMFTPENLALATPDPLDRPYAGWLFVGGRVYRESGNVLDRAELTLGVVGPAAGADALQKWWHAAGLLGGIKPRGWSHQLRDEPGLILSEHRIWRYTADLGGLEVQALPQVNVSLGNVFTYAAAGGMLRFGRHLEADWGPVRIAPGLQGADYVNDTGGLAWYGFAGIEGRAVARNIFLDGNSFHAGPSVVRNPFVADFNAGVALLWRGWRTQVTFTERTPEFRGQRGDDRLLTIALTFAD